ncbi:MAG: AAA family ATPase [bacterium]|nr:AAA family ATPase [bacterium]
MRILSLHIERYRGIKRADLSLPANVLFVGPNNIGKSTILEALDLLLGPDRLGHPAAICEHDFFQSHYLDDGVPVEIRIRATLGALSDDDRAMFWTHLECMGADGQIVSKKDVPKGKAGSEDYPFVLQIELVGKYDVEEGEFLAKSYYCCPEAPDGEREECTRSHKRKIGFVYLRSVRTGSRALSLERGTLLDILMRRHEAKPGCWESVLEKLRAVGPTVSNDPTIKPVLERIVEGVNQFIPLSQDDGSTLINVSDLTREHLRKVLTLFLSSQESPHPLPFKNLGTGTANVLVFALLAAIAEQKANVIFAMEEPETSLPPYTQRRIVSFLKSRCQQCIFTSHSPYISEQFLDAGIQLIARADDTLHTEARQLNIPASLKHKIFSRDFRKKFAEGILSRGVLLVEGTSDGSTIYVASEKVSQVDTLAPTLDTLGVTVVDAEGITALTGIGDFFRGCGIPVFAFYDASKGIDDAEMQTHFTACRSHPYGGLERLLAQTLPLDVLKTFVIDQRNDSNWPQKVTTPGPNDAEHKWREYIQQVLERRKGCGYAAALLSHCPPAEVPTDLKGAVTMVTQYLVRN